MTNPIQAFVDLLPELEGQCDGPSNLPVVLSLPEARTIIAVAKAMTTQKTAAAGVAALKERAAELVPFLQNEGYGAGGYRHGYRADTITLITDLLAALEKVENDASALEALKPFAAISNCMDMSWSRKDILTLTFDDNRIEDIELEAFRRAAAELAKHK